LRAWLHGIAAHAALDALRRRRVRDDLRGGSVHELALAADTSDPATSHARRQEMASALGTLKPHPRAALVLRHVYGYDYEQVAAFLGTSPGNVGSLLTRAHASLRERLRATTGSDEGTEAVTAPVRVSR
jgi:RNA polymerase sigma-70 factor (ECF subfamily)